MSTIPILSQLEDIHKFMDDLREQVKFDEARAAARLMSPRLIDGVMQNLEQANTPKERHKNKKIIDLFLAQIKEYETLYEINVDQSIKEQLRGYRVYTKIVIP
mgnify:CR=1 FL=1